MILDKKYIFHKKLNIEGKIKIYVGKNKDSLEQIKNILQKYILFLDKQKSKQYLGLDFEFNKGTIAMAQLNLDKFKFNKQNVILLFDPNDQFITNTFKKIILNKNIWIILHGAESLDLPYLIKQLIKKPKEIVKMFQNLIDTKYLCQYILQKKDGRCKINFFLEQEEIISKQFLDEMLQNEKNMGEIYLIHVDVKNLTRHLLLYSAYDVVFLPELIRKIKKITPFNLIIRITQINYMMKFNLLKDYNQTKNIIGLINNSYFTHLDKHKNRLSDIIPILIKKAQTTQLQRLKLIPGFKKIIELIEKSYLYPFFIKNKNLILINKKGENIKPLDLPDELTFIFENLLNKVKDIYKEII